MPEQKWRPSAESTITRARPASEISSTIAGNSDQNAGIIELALSPRLSRTCAMPRDSSTSKHW